MTCAKRRVICVLSDDLGGVCSGENLCDRPQPACPREPGEGYEKCGSICLQMGHAEVQALATWQARFLGRPPTHALIRGHDRVCDNCLRLLESAGVKHVSFGEPEIGR